jgi:phosphatidylserine/phosphatidylglycerophosphate/cardiolipin synthase-like enzyme
MVARQTLLRINRGVHAHIIARPSHKLKTDKLIEGVGGLRIVEDVGTKVHRLKHLKLHGKMLLANEKRAIVGSISLTPGSFDASLRLRRMPNMLLNVSSPPHITTGKTFAKTRSVR